ncbi:hypothetical protein [Anaeromyxobacter oryzae]|uniref:hypothetical protein n=1 Tax=Anaeromyxobacter oryzae TaxID=2918170 RepID=UPI0020BECC6B|nr:hypothetical protein [Anaeromyxobacter oryzae]
MTVYALLALAFAALGLVSTLFLRHRRSTRLPLDPLPAGLKHLAAHVGSLSRFGADLQVRPGERWRRIGSLGR